MCSSVSASSLFLSTNTRHLLHRRNASLLNTSLPIVVTRRSINRWSSISATITERNVVDVSWFPPEHNAADDYGGWAIVEAPTSKKKGLPPLVLMGIGTSIAVVVTTIAGLSLSRRGFTIKFSSPLNAEHGIARHSAQDQPLEITEKGNDASPTDAEVLEANSERMEDAANQTVVSESNHLKSQEGNLGRIIVPVSVDSTQQEALLMLKKLKIVEDDVKADLLCTRREYARWFVRANVLLERNPKHRIVPDVALSGSLFSAFDDITLDDPDFGAIQSLAEAGIIPSNLLAVNSNSDLHGNNFYFHPERFISRQDLIDWKAQVEYKVRAGVNEKISRSNMGFMDAGEISPGASPQFYGDMLAGNKSILRKVFGQAMRFQPHKPSTKAQAAVTLTSGRISESIKAELSRLEADNSSRQKAMEEIRFELLNRGDISRYWVEKLEEERARAAHVNRVYLTALEDLEQEKVLQENTLADFLMERAAMDCQKQLLLSLKEEIDVMSERVVRESTEYREQRQELQVLLTDAQARLERTLNTKSVLETEIEALQILRSWIEDEARKSQARAKVLEDAGRRWRGVEQD